MLHSLMGFTNLTHKKTGRLQTGYPLNYRLCLVCSEVAVPTTRSVLALSTTKRLSMRHGKGHGYSITVCLHHAGGASDNSQNRQLPLSQRLEQGFPVLFSSNAGNVYADMVWCIDCGSDQPVSGWHPCLFGHGSDLRRIVVYIFDDIVN